MMTAADVLTVLDLLERAGFEAWVDGGWGVDALLGLETRPHDDVDLVLPIERLDEAFAVLAGAGFQLVRDLRPTAIALRHPDGQEVDVHLVTGTTDGGADQDLSGDPALSGSIPFHYGAPATGLVSGRVVRCVDAGTQLRAHRGYPLRDRDREDVARLAGAFDLPLPPECVTDRPRQQAGGVPRIVAGWAGSLQLQVPPDGTRPTSDRTREALFSMLEARDAVRGAAVLDLYAGSGALGLEALSRGAASAVLVERAPRAVRVIEANVARLRRAAPKQQLEVRVVRRSVEAFLAGGAGPVDLVLSDPPYDLGDDAVGRDLVALAPLVAPGGLVLVERATRSPAPSAPEGLDPIGVRTYGDTAVHLFTTAG